MVELKRGTTPTLQVKFDIENLDDIESVEFLLKQDCKEECTHFVLKTYPSESASLDSETGVFHIRYTEQETRTFTHDSRIYLDTRPIMKDGTIVPTEIVSLFMYNTLFSSENGGE